MKQIENNQQKKIENNQHDIFDFFENSNFSLSDFDTQNDLNHMIANYERQILINQQSITTQQTSVNDINFTINDLNTKAAIENESSFYDSVDYLRDIGIDNPQSSWDELLDTRSTLELSIQRLSDLNEILQHNLNVLYEINSTVIQLSDFPFPLLIPLLLFIYKMDNNKRKELKETVIKIHKALTSSFFQQSENVKNSLKNKINSLMSLAVITFLIKKFLTRFGQYKNYTDWKRNIIQKSKHKGKMLIIKPFNSKETNDSLNKKAKKKLESDKDYEDAMEKASDNINIANAFSIIQNWFRWTNLDTRFKTLFNKFKYEKTELQKNSQFPNSTELTSIEQDFRQQRAFEGEQERLNIMNSIHEQTVQISQIRESASNIIRNREHFYKSRQQISTEFNNTRRYRENALTRQVNNGFRRDWLKTKKIIFKILKKK